MTRFWKYVMIYIYSKYLETSSLSGKKTVKWEAHPNDRKKSRKSKLKQTVETTVQTFA